MINSYQFEEGMMDQTRNLAANTRITQSQCDLMNDATDQEVQDVLLDRRSFDLDKQEFEQFEALLDSRPAPNNELRNLLKTEAPWE